MASQKFIAFLRGINVGGRTVKMDQLRSIFESIGFTNIKTVLASGNVIFESTETNPALIQQKITNQLVKSTGHNISVIIRGNAEIERLLRASPFEQSDPTTNTRLYVTFLPEPVTNHPTITAHKGFHILHTSPSEVFSVVSLSEDHGTIDAMEVLDKTYGKQITTRNWNTLQKISASYND